MATTSTMPQNTLGKVLLKPPHQSYSPEWNIFVVSNKNIPEFYRHNRFLGASRSLIHPPKNRLDSQAMYDQPKSLDSPTLGPQQKPPLVPPFVFRSGTKSQHNKLNTSPTLSPLDKPLSPPPELHLLGCTST